MREWIVQISRPQRLDTYLLWLFPALSRGTLHKALRENKIKLNAKKQPLNTLLHSGDVVTLYLREELLCPSIPILYEDENLLIVNKPAGIAVDGDGDTLLGRVFETMRREKRLNESNPPVLCHRLDTGTSGLLLLAKTEEAENFLTYLLKIRAIDKRYLCVTVGHPQPASATLHGYLRKDAKAGRVFVVSQPESKAKEIITQYETLAVSGQLSLLEVKLITGRTHQIRAHLASIGCPILGDSKYGDESSNRARKLKYQALCAWKLTMPACIENKTFDYLSGRQFQAPMPWYCKQIFDGTLQ